MNKKVIYSIIGGAVFAGLAIAAYTFLSKAKTFAKKLNNGKPLKLLFIGDSLTVNKNSYADQLKAKYPNIEITKIAEIGKTTEWMLNQYHLDNNKYDAVFILGGLNDIYAKSFISDTKLNIQKIIDDAKVKGSFVVAITPPPSGNYSLYNTSKQLLHDELNNYIKHLNTDLIIDLYSLVENSDNKGHDLPQYNISDGLHLTNTAHTLLMNEILKKL